ncbi:PREDICTED: protein CHROMOSOME TRANSMISSION FIDELITY 7 [Fragaria vesca subsp. vesca]|uniref:protein CHROMOSOME TRANSMISSION FIDELITY 7 n=1 Tax=Fragaria vesca subsp. vesca TaxID=101020 RepID=UPI0002C3204C|nr:PREDICTED: protein CHROMOSOME TRANSMISSION FIDELITY 7 [Fragaria vesca subsp. vesca]
MQSKISTFFKPSSSSSSVSPKPADPSPILHEDDELSIWEKKQHQQLSTYKRRAPNPQWRGSDCGRDSQLAKTPVSDVDSPRPESMALGKTVTKNKKRSYAQYHLDLGQSDFLLHTCAVCGVMYVTGDQEDEKAHKGFHNDYTRGIQFKGWCNERVVYEPKVGGGRILLVLDSDPPAQRNKVEKVVTMMETELGSGWILPKLFKVYLFVLSARIVGCLVAEPITKAHKVLSSAVDGSSNSASATTNKTKLFSLQFGEIKFQREVIRKAPSAPEPLNEYFTGAIICEKEAVPAVCGIRAIWVTPANRRKHIATHLLDALRKNFCMGLVLEHSQLAFSQLTSAGNALVSNYIGGGNFLLYNTNNVAS